MALRKEKEIDDRQFGCRKQRSTIDEITKILSRFNGKEERAAIFYDIEKTYNKVNK